MNQNKVKVGVILDCLQIKKWQLEALDNILDIAAIDIILNCTNTTNPRNYFKNFIYYVINIMWMKVPYTKNIKFDPGIIPVRNFSSNYEGSWQLIPAEVTQEVGSKNLDFIIRFGMNLILNPDDLNAKYGVVSYHHGDPDYYRGRPPGYYETINNSDCIGIIVQKLSNKIDGGLIYEKKYSKIYKHSYRRTSNNLYKNSITLLKKAINNCLLGQTIVNTANGKLYSLPNNYNAFLFIQSQFLRGFKRILKGLFLEKKWNIAITKNAINFEGCETEIILNLDDAQSPKLLDKYSFYADPFFSLNSEGVYFEGLSKFSGCGEILYAPTSNLNKASLILKGGHLSYPQVIQMDDRECLLPEMCFVSSPRLYSIDGKVCKSDLDLKFEFEADLRCVDLTNFYWEGSYYIFTSILGSEDDTLHLYHSENLLGPYVGHMASPIVIDPRSARMAGNIFSVENRIFRMGQNCSHEYGSSIKIFEIKTLNLLNYKESEIKEIFVSNGFGPHTINFKDGEVLYDYYFNKLDFFAGARRALALLYRRGEVE